MTDQPTDKGGVKWPEEVWVAVPMPETPEEQLGIRPTTSLVPDQQRARGNPQNWSECPYVPKHLYEQERERVEALWARLEHEQDLALAAHDRAEAAEQKLGEVEAEKREAVIAWAEQREQLKEVEAAVREEVERLEDKAASIRRARGGSHVSFAEASAYDHVAVRLRSRFPQALQTSKPDREGNS